MQREHHGVLKQGAPETVLIIGSLQDVICVLRCSHNLGESSNILHKHHPAQDLPRVYNLFLRKNFHQWGVIMLPVMSLTWRSGEQKMESSKAAWIQEGIAS